MSGCVGRPASRPTPVEPGGGEMRRFVIGAVLLVAAVGGVTAAVLVPAQAATGSTIVSAASGRCLDVVGQAQTDKTGVNIYDCNGQANQAWTFTAAGELRVYSTPKCLDVAGQDTTAPAVVQIYSCN